MEQKPSIGRIVHIVVENSGDEVIHLPAIIISVNDDKSVNLQAFSTAGIFIYQEIEEDQKAESILSWHWPERV